LVSGQLVELGSPTFPVTPNAVVGNTDVNTGFLVKLDGTGAKILVAIRGFGLGPVAYDGNDNIYVAGAAYGDGGISATPGAFQSTHVFQACGGSGMVGFACSYQYVAKISSDGAKLLYSTFVTGSFGAVPLALAIDSMGNALVAGTTNSRDFPVTPGAYQEAYRAANMPPPPTPTPHPTIYPPPSTGYLTKLNANGTGLVWSTFFSGTGSETITGLSLDSEYRIIITGRSGSTDLPGAQPVPTGCAPDFSRNLAYVAQLSADATALIAARYVYGLDANSTVRLALRPDGTPFVASGDALKPIDLTASTPLACAIDPADNFRINHAAPGQLITVFGDDFGDGAIVSINGIAAPLLYTSRQQINAQVPIELASQDVVTLTVQTAGRLSMSRPLRIVDRAPSAFLVLQDFNPARTGLTCNGFTFSPGYPPVARNEDGSWNACDNPAAPSSILTFYLNGLGAATPSVTLKYPGSGDVLAVEQDPESPSGVWRMRVRLPPNANSGALVPLIEGVPLREAYLGVWVK
jgi:uncharacterized protein (TIGR03437 family)